jgi:hypothetical protein
MLCVEWIFNKSRQGGILGLIFFLQGGKKNFLKATLEIFIFHQVQVSPTVL